MKTSSNNELKLYYNMEDLINEAFELSLIYYVII